MYIILIKRLFVNIILVKYINIQLINRKGPNGTKLTFLFKRIIRDTGSAKKLAIKRTNKPRIGLITSPNTNINLISPPPKLSFLNKKFPISITRYINKNKLIPDNILNKALITPLFKQVIIRKYPEKNISN